MRPSESDELEVAPAAGSAVSASTDASAAGTTSRTLGFMNFPPPLVTRWLSAQLYAIPPKK